MLYTSTTQIPTCRDSICTVTILWRGRSGDGFENNKLSSRDVVEMKPEMANAIEASGELDMSHSPHAPSVSAATDRRDDPDRRKRTLYSLAYGSFNPRRR